MVWHIVRKDWRLLWPLVAALASLQVLLAVARFGDGHFLDFPNTPASLLQLLAAVAVIALVVLQDPIPGARQDWLVRPIRRRDLLLAKLVFVLLFVQGPWFVTDLLQGVANGFPFGQSAAAATACAAWVLLTVGLPVLAFASVAATMTETILAAFGVFAVLIGFLIVPNVLGITRPTLLTGFAFAPSLVRQSLWLVAAAGVLVLQYRWRRTGVARALLVGALLVGPCAQFLPWPVSVRLQQLLAAGPADDGGVAVAFAGREGRYRPGPGQGLDDVPEKPGMGPVDVAAENQRRRAEGARTVFLPIHVSGLPPNSRLLADRSEIVLIDRDGSVVHKGTGNDLELRAAGTDATVHQGIRIPGALYSRLKDRALDVHLEYSFTLFRPDTTFALPARGADQRMPGIGWCATTVDDAGTRVLIGCMQPGERPSCLAVVLEHPPTGRRNPEVSLCAPDYSPYPGHVLPDAMSRFTGRLPFYDPSGLVRYPVGGPELSEARVLVTAFTPVRHVVKRVVIPGVRLEDWEPAREVP